MTDDTSFRETLDDPAAFEAALSGFVSAPLADDATARILGGARNRAAVPRTTRERVISWWERLAASPRLVPALALSLLLANLGLDASVTRLGPPLARPSHETEVPTFTSSDLGLSSSWLDARIRLARVARRTGAEGLHRPGLAFDTTND